jgi:hypothetical protein
MIKYNYETLFGVDRVVPLFAGDKTEYGLHFQLYKKIPVGDGDPVLCFGVYQHYRTRAGGSWAPCSTTYGKGADKKDARIVKYEHNVSEEGALGAILGNYMETILEAVGRMLITESGVDIKEVKSNVKKVLSDFVDKIFDDVYGNIVAKEEVQNEGTDNPF